jgi:hypothetical protein
MEKILYFSLLGILCLILSRAFPIFLIFILPAAIGLLGCIAYKFLKGN